MSAETSWRRRWKPSLKSTAWQRFLHPGETFLFKFVCSSKNYEFMLTDTVDTYLEILDEPQILQRTRKLNPSVEAPMHKILDHLRQHMDNQTTGKVSVKIGDKCIVTLETKLAGLPFVWKFVASQCEPGVACQHVTLPLMAMVEELLRRQEELARLLQRKDKEIEDYKAQGTKVTRKHLQTVPFDMTAFNDNMVTSQGFEAGVSRLGENAFSTEGRTLYTDVMTKHAWLTRDRGDEEEDEVSSSPERGRAPGQSWASRIPGSVVSPSVSPSKSPSKHSPHKTSPEKAEDTELLRRQALEKRLAEEEDKKEQKKKKKKLKL